MNPCVCQVLVARTRIASSEEKLPLAHAFPITLDTRPIVVQNVQRTQSARAHWLA